MANSPKVPKLNFKRALALNGYTTGQLTDLVCDLIRNSDLTKYETIPTDFMESISTVIDAIYMRRTKEGGLDKSCLSYPRLVEEYESVSEAELETLVKVMEQKNKKGDQTTSASKRVHKLYVEKEKKMIGKLVEAKLFPSDLTADDLSHSNNNTDKYCTNIIQIADKVLGYVFKTRDRDDVLKNIQKLIELCHGTILGRYLSNVGKEVHDDRSVLQWESHSYVIVSLTVLLAALDLRYKQETGKHGNLLVKESDTKKEETNMETVDEPMDTEQVSSSASSDVQEEEIFSLAEAIGDHDKLMELGVELGFDIGEVHKFQKKNKGAGGAVSCKGTLNLLKAWQLKNKSANNQREILKAGLKEAKLGLYAEECLSTTDSPRVEQKELVALAVAMGDTSKLTRLGLALKVGNLNTINGFVRDNRDGGGQITSQGTLELLLSWLEDNKSANPRLTLQNALQKAGLTLFAELHLP